MLLHNICYMGINIEYSTPCDGVGVGDSILKRIEMWHFTKIPRQTKVI